MPLPSDAAASLPPMSAGPQVPPRPGRPQRQTLATLDEAIRAAERAVIHRDARILGHVREMDTTLHRRLHGVQRYGLVLGVASAALGGVWSLVRRGWRGLGFFSTTAVPAAATAAATSTSRRAGWSTGLSPGLAQVASLAEPLLTLWTSRWRLNPGIAAVFAGLVLPNVVRL